jgi:hypothetical protein
VSALPHGYRRRVGRNDSPDAALQRGTTVEELIFGTRDVAVIDARIDRFCAIAARAKARAHATPSGPQLAGHGDWSGKHFRFGGDRITAVFASEADRFSCTAALRRHGVAYLRP